MTKSMSIVLPLTWLLIGHGGPVNARIPAGNQGAAVAHGWLYPSGATRIVRFVSETKVEGHPKTFVPFQTSGFIFLLNDTFSISVSQPDDVLLLKYRDGLLSRTSSVVSEDQHPKRLSFSDAISETLNEVACDGLGGLCKKLLSHKGGAVGRNQQGSLLPNLGMFEAVVGDDPGDLRKFTVSCPIAGSGLQKTVCTFTVVYP